jgi:hypothetical protein
MGLAAKAVLMSVTIVACGVAAPEVKSIVISAFWSKDMVNLYLTEVSKVAAMANPTAAAELKLQLPIGTSFPFIYSLALFRFRSQTFVSVAWYGLEPETVKVSS